MTKKAIGRNYQRKQDWPSVKHVNIYLLEKGFSQNEVNTIIKTIISRGWKTQTGISIKNWKQYLFQWQYVLKFPQKRYKRNRK